MIQDDSVHRAAQDAVRLLAHTRHELGTPLNAIVGYSEMLLEDADREGRSALMPDLNRIHEAGMHLLSVVNDIQDPAKTNPAMPESQFEDLWTLLGRQLRAPLDVVIARSEALLQTAKSFRLTDCLADLERIRTAGLKLLSILEERGAITGGDARVSRENQVSQLTPVPQPDSASWSDTLIRRPSSPPGAEAAALLVVDDNETNRDILSRYLQRHGHQVTTSQGGLEALAVLEARPFDLVLLDVMMPDIDGYEVLRRLKADARFAEIPVIFISALNDTQGKVQAFRAGGADYVTKPFHAEEVIARVENQLRLSRLQKDLSRQNQELLRKNEELTRAQKRTDLVFSALAEALPGTVLDGKYRLEEKIGTGGFGAVFRGRHLSLDRPVAIKVFRPTAGNDSSDALERFRREGISASRIQHPNTVEILDNGISSTGIAYLVMELLDGHTLAAELREKGKLSPRRTLEIIAPVCETLSEIHAAGMVHRDIKPENIFLHHDRRGEVVKLLDYGLSKLRETDSDQTRETMASVVAGTPAYIAPERLLNHAYDGRADVYSLGVTLYRMLCGELPFQSKEGSNYTQAMLQLTQEAPSLRACNPDFPASLDELVERMLAKDPEQRPTAKELSGILSTLISA